MTHPNSLDLEAFAGGETIASVASHLGDCTACTAFVERLRGAIEAGPSRTKAADAVARAAARSAHVDEDVAAPAVPPAKTSELTRKTARETAQRRWLMTASTLAVPLAAAAALLLFLRTPPPKDAPGPTPIPTATGGLTPTTTDPDPETTFKGGIQIAVIRERAGQQVRFTGRVQVRPGDRLRAEVALDQEQAILAAVLGDDGSWLELMSEGVRRPGTHFSERSARVDGSPLRGTILVGSPEDITRARNTKRIEGLAAIRVEWEAP